MQPAPVKTLLIVAAENSAAQYAFKIMKTLGGDIQYFGIGDELMKAEGFHAVADTEEMAVMGFQEVLGKYKLLRQRYHALLAEIDLRRPRVALLIDYPGFNLKLAKDLKARGVFVLYFVSPQVWAWKKGRIKTIKAVVDRMLVLFPFEEDFYRENGVDVEYVGHPLVENVDPDLFLDESKALQRSRFGFSSGDFVIGLMPGSRKSEIAANFPTQLEAARRLAKRYSNVKIAILKAPNVSRESLMPYLRNVAFPFTLLQDEPYQMIRNCQFMICTSGTATLQVAMAACPMVIMYKVNTLTALIGKLIVGGKIPLFGLPNILLGKMNFTELFQERASVDNIVSDAERYYLDESFYSSQKNLLLTIRDMFSGKRPIESVCRHLSELL